MGEHVLVGEGHVHELGLEGEGHVHNVHLVNSKQHLVNIILDSLCFSEDG